MGYLVLRGYLNADGLLFTLPLMLYGLAFILTVEIPDMEADRLGHKQTWVVRKGRGFAFTAVGALLLAATVFFSVFPISIQIRSPWIFVSWALSPCFLLQLVSLAWLKDPLIGKRLPNWRMR